MKSLDPLSEVKDQVTRGGASFTFTLPSLGLGWVLCP